MFKPNNLAVVIAHGLYHTAAAYQPLIEAFAAQSVAAYCPQLPSSDFNHLNVGDVQNPDFDRPPPDGGYPQGDEDVEALLAVLKALIEEQGKEVLLLAHSAGGWTATQAAVSALQKNVRKAEGKEGGVVGLLFYSGFVIPVGESIHSFFQPKDGSTVVVPDWLQFHKHGADGLGTLTQPERFLFHDLQQEDAAKWAKELTASPVMKTKLTNDAYAELPCGYLVLDGDRILPREYQEGMVALQESKTGKWRMWHCPAGHAAHLSWTEGVVDTALEFLGGL